jgi:hypothetical protein
MVSEIAFPQQSGLNGRQGKAFYRDAFSCNTHSINLQPREVYHGIYGFLPRSVKASLALRNIMVKPFGIAKNDLQMNLAIEDMKAGQKAGFMTVETANDKEIICTSTELHMDLWISVLKLAPQQFAVSSLINLNTTTAKVYMASIKPFHKLTNRYCIARAVKSGRL